MLPGAPAEADNVRDAQWHLGFMRASEAQQLTNGGEGIVVAVIDSGVDASHPDLVGNVFPGADFVNLGGDGHVDADGHGTGMAGLIAGHGHGDAGALGVAPRAKILPVKAGAGGFNNAPVVAQGVTWATQHGAKIMCLAFSGPNDSDVLRNSVKQAQDADVVVVAGAGNKPVAKDVGYPAAYPGVIAAVGIDRQGNHADVSVTGSQAVLAAPAVDIVSTGAGGKYRKGVGTSDATAIISGVAALVRAKYPNLSAAEVVHRLTATAIDKGPPGRDNEYGFGVVDPVAALTADVPPLAPSSAPANGDAGAAPPTAAAPDRSGGVPVGILAVLVGVMLLAAALIAGFVVVRRSRRA